jgi:hypothetical protein
VIDELKSTQAGDAYDSKYRSLTSDKLKANLATLKDILPMTDNQKLIDLVNFVIKNESALLEQAQ